MKPLEGYLKKNQESLRYSPLLNGKKFFDAVCVIPSLAEYENLDKLLNSLEKNDPDYLKKTLFLFVVNNTKSVSEEIRTNNLKTFNRLKEYKGVLNINVIDAFSEGNELNEKDGGVGLARKIGMDNALKYFDNQNWEKGIIINLDSDCSVSTDYLKSILTFFKNADNQAAYVDYHHPLTDKAEVNKAIINYEIFLRYYVLGLNYTSSPYAFHTIGSTMVCNAKSYVIIGGMNKRKAGEDFYFMEKLSKYVPVKKIPTGTVYPSPRPSWRVPFGTGQRVNRFIAGKIDEYKVYNPESFKILKSWVNVFYNGDTSDTKSILNEANNISSFLYKFLIENNFENSWSKILSNAKTEAQVQKQKKFWFDGFRTLKLIHFMRDNAYPNVDTFEGTNRLLKKLGERQITEVNKNSPIGEQMKVLTMLRSLG